ncbi:MAG: Tol-Pal system beta propeller repeat protein TolB [Gammaproteobacteria bacterium]|jgi:TolB protein
MLKRTAVLLCLLLSAPAHAVLDIKITQGMEEALPIAVIPFAFDGDPKSLPMDMHVTIANDLARSGRFKPMHVQDMPQKPSDFKDVNFHDWRLLGMENLVIGSIKQLDDGGYEIQFRLLDVYQGTQIAGFRIPTSRDQFRRTAHRISDVIFEKLTGIRGAFNTRIAYVTVKKQPGGDKQYTLQIADADGFDPKVLVQSSEPLMSPAWSPDGRSLAYVSFEGKNSSIYIQDVGTGQRRQVAAFPGINSAPAFSPDGSQLAMTLSKGGNPEIYIMQLSDGSLRRLTHNPAIDTEPDWSPDGSKIVFTSDRGGSPQIYQKDLDSGEVKRLTFDGSYNARPRYSPDGKFLTMVHGENGNFRIAVLNLRQGYLDVLTRASLDESPCYAPNGSMIIYATAGPQGSELAAVSSDGRVHQRLALQDGEVEEPAWGPFPSSK